MLQKRSLQVCEHGNKASYVIKKIANQMGRGLRLSWPEFSLCSCGIMELNAGEPLFRLRFADNTPPDI
jgi:hypothetical protein